MDISLPHSLSQLSQAELGRLGEEYAARYLRTLGWVILERNWRVRFGEIDIIARTPSGCVVVVEVKTRRSVSAGIPAAAVTRAKAQRLRCLAGAWLAEARPRCSGVRIDIISWEALDDHTLRLDHLRSAA